MNKEREFPNTLIGVSHDGQCFLIVGHLDLVELMDGSLFEDNCQNGSTGGFPKEPGVYRATVEYWFQQGFFEGYEADGESEWDFVCTNSIKMMP